MLNKIIKEIENIKKSKKFTNKKIGIIISITTNPNTKEFEIFPLRDFADYVFVPISIKSDKNGILLAKEIDGKIDSLVFDTENKITSCQHLFDKINQKWKKTNVSWC